MGGHCHESLHGRAKMSISDHLGYRHSRFAGQLEGTYVAYQPRHEIKKRMGNLFTLSIGKQILFHVGRWRVLERSGMRRQRGVKYLSNLDISFLHHYHSFIHKL